MLATRTSQPSVKLILIFAFLTALVLFAGLSASLDSVRLTAIEERWLLLLRSQPGGMSARFFGAITWLGSDYVLGVVVLLGAVVLFRLRQTPELLGLLAVGVSTKVLEHGLKLIFHRARPELLGPAAGMFGDHAFPSGHSLNTAAIYGFILILVGANVSSTFWKSLIVVTGALLILAIGLSRVILKTHWPSDVVAGWLVAAMLLSVVFFVLSLLKGRFDVRISSAKPG
jgi:undecaprenyl-diphosphatase